MEEKELQELERALRAAAPGLRPATSGHFIRADDLLAMIGDLREARRLLGEVREWHLPGSGCRCGLCSPIQQRLAAFLGAQQWSSKVPDDPHAHNPVIQAVLGKTRQCPGCGGWGWPTSLDSCAICHGDPLPAEEQPAPQAPQRAMQWAAK